jgi:hypothetical protein
LLASSGCGEDATPERATATGDEPDGGGGCASGTLIQDDGSCLAAGPAAFGCADGFIPGGDGSCEPALPADECADGLVAVPGDARCRPLADCGDGTWGSIPVDATTEHVDASYAGTDSDGTAAHPWPTIAEGVAAAQAGAVVAVAAGSYPESVALQKPVRLLGRCPSLVEVAAPASAFGTIVISSGADGSEIRGLALTGGGAGIAASGVTGVTVSEMWIHDTGAYGFDAETALGRTSLAVTDVLIERARDAGSFLVGSNVSFDRTVIRATRPGPLATGGGVVLRASPEAADRGSASLDRCVLSDNAESAAYVAGGDLSIEASVIRRTRPNAQAAGGRAVNAQLGPASSRSTVTVRTSVLEDNLSLGIAIIGSDATVEGTVVRRTELEQSSGGFGMGIAVEIDRDTGTPASLDLRSSLIDASKEAGVLVVAAPATIASTILRGTGGSFGGAFGDGVAVVSLYGPASLTLQGCTLADNGRADVTAFGASASLRANLLDCTPIHLDGEVYEGQDPTFSDEGGNRCGCGDTTVACAVLSSMLTPPSID